ncbi:type II secretion system secretin GspD [Endozoicomonas sp. G2_2]|uniref:type II secretion system secretin GspD n=1 Tax=Endozoicomonas sp. G2_2 TaxID=2821092 RepID=UPI001ADC7021|nr:type II secretion system secretin GspD [Endozoicomonas sp. G2_2]MBO9471240.1 type II secretion system secretin GspD [Endozoicomonas sp. G2_2]
MTAIVLRRFFCLLALSLFAMGTATAQTATSQTATTQGDSFTLNLKDADITTLIATVSEVTGRNFVVDPRVKGDVTVLSTEPMTPSQLYETFLSVLEVHGFAAVPSGEVTKIIPQINAKQDGGFGRRGGNATREDIVTRVINVDNVPADQLVPILRPLVPQYGHLAAYSASNTLIISDRAANAQRMAEIVAKIDRNGLKDVESIRLQYASASEVAAVVDQLKAGASGNAAAGNFTIIPDERTNSVIISGGRQERLRLRAIIADLDTESEQSGGTQVVYLDYADAETIAPVLQNYADGQGATSASSGGNGGNASSSAARRPGGGANGVSVIAEPGANALVVTAPADTMRQIKQVIEQLDIRRGQVLVEAIIAEVSLTRSRQLGVNVAAFENGGPAAASILDQDTLTAVPSLAMDGTPLSLIQQGLNVALGDINDSGTGFAVLVNALSGNTNTNVLSTPSLITRDNEEAEIKVGQEVPFVTGNYTSGTTGGGVNNGLTNPFQTIERKDVGLTLGFTPQISAGDTIQLTIDQEISSIAQGSSQTGAVDLITNNRTLTTSVEVENGQILVLGGLIDDQVTESEQKVPLLGDIPLLGALFTFRNVQKNKRNLLNFIRPTILRGGGEADYYTRKKYNYIRSLQEQQAETSIPLMGEEQRPQLPPINEYDDSDSFSEDSGVSNNESTPRDSDRDARGGKRRGDQF